MASDIVITRGGGDIGSGVIQKLYRAGFKVLVLELEHPLVIRRTVSFAQSVMDGETVLEGIRAVEVNSVEDVKGAWEREHIPVLMDPQGLSVGLLKPLAVIDATLAKRNTGMHRAMAPITIGLGPGFRAGEDVDVVIETNRRHNLGRLIFEGCAEPDTGVPAPVAPQLGRVRRVGAGSTG